MKVFYHADNDGKCAGYWVKTLNELTDNFADEYIKINYGMDFPFESIGKDEIVYIVDYSISPEEMDRLLDITKNVIWIDHHKSAIEKYNDYDKEIAGLRYDGVAGCMLTYVYLKYIKTGEHFDFDKSLIKNAPYCTKLIADYDVWTFEYGYDTRKFQKGFELHSHEPTDVIWNTLNSTEDWETAENAMNYILANGEAIINYRKSMMAEYCKNKGFEAMFEDYKCFVINMAMVSSDDFVIDNIDDYDILIGFSYDGDNWNYSLRSTKVDCAVLAMKYGGGGHKGAAGFNSNEFVLRKL